MSMRRGFKTEAEQHAAELRQEIEQQSAALRLAKSVSNKFTRHEDADGLRVIEMEEVRWSLR